MAEPVTIRLSKDKSKLLVQLTSMTSIALPMNDKGMTILRQVMMERDKVDHAVISTPAAPTQHQIEQWLLALAAGKSPTQVAPKKAPADLSLEDLGL